MHVLRYHVASLVDVVSFIYKMHSYAAFTLKIAKSSGREKSRH